MIDDKDVEDIHTALKAITRRLMEIELKMDQHGVLFDRILHYLLTNKKKDD